MVCIAPRDAIYEKMISNIEQVRARHGQVIAVGDEGDGLLAAKADVREELDRLRSHIVSARALIGSGDAVGRRLDFLSQEFNREANTLCSKAFDRRLTTIGMELKAVIDQFREQVQNLA